MVAIEELRQTNDAYFIGRPIVAVFIGGTSGIGENGVKALARLANVKSSTLRVYIAGRSQENFDRIKTEVLAIYPQAQLTFVRASDIRLLKEVDRITDEIMRQERAGSDQTPRIDLLCMSQGELNLAARTETKEGVDGSMSLIYYSRIKCITNLLPLLLEAERPHVVSIFAGGLETANFQRDDMSLRKAGNYSVWNARTHACIMKTLFFERLAAIHPSLSLVHTFPGLVDTPLFDRGELGFLYSLLWRLFGRIMVYFAAHSAADSGTRTLYCATPHFPAKGSKAATDGDATSAAIGTDGNRASGAYATGETSDPVTPKFDYVKARGDGLAQMIWDHTQRVFRDVEQDGKTES